MNKRTNCKTCNKRLQGRQVRFCSIKCKNRAHQSYDAQKARGLKRKIELVQLSGGRCYKCGYKKNLAALSFHHKDSDKKEFRMDVRSLSNRRESKIESEFEKCVLLCHNCHTEVHNPHLDLESISSSRLL